MTDLLLSPDEKNQFFEKGFFLKKNVFNFHELQPVIQCFERVLERSKSFQKTSIENNTQYVVDKDRIERAVWVLGAEPQLRSMAHDPRILAIVCQLFGQSELVQLISQFHFKLPGDKVAFDWHQDSTNRWYGTKYWSDVTGWGSYVQSLVAVDRSFSENGPLQFMPFTVAKGHLRGGVSPDIDDLSTTHEIVEMFMEPGDMVLFHPFAIHGSKINTSSQPRRVFINGFTIPGVNSRFYPGCGLGETVVFEEWAQFLKSA